ncbi:DNA (cytosine-5-)-methyltransferase [Bacillus wiedmannii]|uniref:Cytosine-specific methyltransferase n=1 Tax=Bacillus wiedmannii TaxID=1890302 RepID=A0ABX5DP27_9BACI|nr:DNA (cytosine-5-)-methyltransferase [Bacillus wiedmannii]
MGMEQAGHKCLGYVECDPRCEKCKKFTKHIPSTKHNHTICTECGKEKRQHARFSYESIHNAKGEWTAHDITTVTNDDLRLLRGTVDVICGGFPCQAFSIAGKRLGFAETRGTLFFEIARFAKEIQPQYLFLENVKGLLNHDGGNTFRTILSTLDELGYDAEWQVLNSKDIGPKPVPQNRERVFIIGHLRGRSRREIFPIRKSCAETDDSRVVTGTLTTRYPASQREGTYIEEIRKCKRASREVSDVGPKILAVRGRYNNSGSIDQKAELRSDKITNTLTTVAKDNYLINGHKIRKLTPRECWRLQGFPDWAFDRAREVNSDSQLYKQAGNSVTVNVIHAIAERLI